MTGQTELFLWRRTDWKGRRWVEDIFINASPSGYAAIIKSLRRMREHGREGTCRFASRPATREDVARISHETDHRTLKSTKKKPFAGFDVAERLREAGARMEWLGPLVIQWSADGLEDTLRLSGREVQLTLGSEGLEAFISECEAQSAGWGNEGCFGARLSYGLAFAPDWLGIE
ncbi:hypothetical protein [Archangium violaceum]|uniref:Uncharacterized protein n=1 Tax=Archangium violaceum Cb vi76 TaxID=1406225 RepID=A0A084SPU4_9BACT|nr:hypothetical protein [Archangium violaceum]KFA90479.1 hypothetical protein Q664_28230 [Archangium violaceum Cb vi76]